MTRYELFRTLDSLLEIVQINEHTFNKFVISGDLAKDFYDYDQGFYDISMFYFYTNDKHWCRVWVGTFDDGDLGSWNEFETKEKAIGLLHKVVEKIRPIRVCPSYEKFNEYLRDIGVYLVYE
jgi:hypothetical protein